MNGYNIVVNSNDIKNRQVLINQKYDELYKMVQNYQKMIDDTEAIIETKSAKQYRLIAHRYLDIVLLYLNNEFKEYINKLDNVINLYSEFYDIEKNVVGKSDSSEV